MSIKVEILSEEISTKSGISSKTGKQYNIREQDGWGYFFDQKGQPHPHPQKVRLMLDDDQAAYPKGIYVLAPESFYPDRFGQISVRATLRPFVQESSAVKRVAA